MNIEDKAKEKSFNELRVNRKRVSDLEAIESDTKNDKQDLLNSNAILEALSFAPSLLLRETSWKEYLQKMLAHLGHATGASRVYIFKNHINEDGILLTSKQYEWVAPGIKSHIDNIELQNIPWIDAGFDRWMEVMEQGEHIFGRVRDFPISEQKVLAPRGIISIVAIPVFVNQEWWGFVGFDECKFDCIWSDVEVDALKIAAFILGASIQSKRNEDQLRLIKSLIDQSNDATFITDPETGIFLDVNETMCKNSGYSRIELLGMKVMDIETMIPLNISWAEHVQEVRNRSCMIVEGEHKRKDGTTFPVEVNVKIISHKNMDYMLAAVRDISDRRNIEKQLYKLSSAIKQYPSSIVIIDVNGIIDYVNPLFSEATGYSYDEVIGESITILELSSHHSELYDEILKAVTAGKVWRGDVCIRTKNSELIWELLSFSPLKDEKGNIGYILVAKIEDTERRLAEEALRKSEASLIESQRIAHMGSWEWNVPDNKVIHSEENYRIFGVTPEEFELSYEGFINIVHPDDRQFVEESIYKALNERMPYCIDFRILRPDGTERFVHDQAEVTYNEAGHPIRMVGTIHDLTERKKMEDELLMAQKLESLSILAGGIAHDFNNLLTGIIGNIELAQAFSKPGDKIYEKLVQSEKASLRAANLAHQLLTFSKGGIPDKKTIFLKGLIKDSTDFTLRGTNIRHEISIVDNLWPVEADEGQISQVINNLIINADQAMPKGGTIRVRATNVTIDAKHALPLTYGRYVKICIADEGVGISKEKLRKIFDPYYTTKEKGSGLGLVTSHSIIRRHNGLLTVKSNIGRGTTFYIYLPASQKEPVTDKIDEDGVYFDGGKRILVMDDEKIIRDIASEMLSHIGYEVRCARDGEEVVELYEVARKSGKPFDAVVMDLTIPGGTGGKEAIKRLHAIDPDIKAILSSGYSNDPIMSDYKRYGFRGIVSKPYQLRELSKTVHRVLKGVRE